MCSIVIAPDSKMTEYNQLKFKNQRRGKAGHPGYKHNLLVGSTPCSIRFFWAPTNPQSAPSPYQVGDNLLWFNGMLKGYEECDDTQIIVNSFLETGKPPAVEGSIAGVYAVKQKNGSYSLKIFRNALGALYIDRVADYPLVSSVWTTLTNSMIEPGKFYVMDSTDPWQQAESFETQQPIHA